MTTSFSTGNRNSSPAPSAHGPALDAPTCLSRPVLHALCPRAKGARGILTQVALRVPIDVRLPDGRPLGGADRREAGFPVIQLVRPDAVFERIGHHPKIGIGEAYMAGDWRIPDGDDLAAALAPFAARMTTAVPPALLKLRRIADRALPSISRNTVTGSQRNIEAHYDLSNELFAAFLDESLTYSSALFEESGTSAGPWPEQSLEAAQRRKVAAVLDLAGVGAGTRLLEIGTGWGTLAIEAARRGARVDTITLSREQRALALERIAAAGLSDRIEVRLEDYRLTRGQYDAVVSVEMIEAVGEEFWGVYFQTIADRLLPGGRAAVQAILMNHERYLATRHSYGWIQKHIFPGGLIPSIEAIEGAAARTGKLAVTAVHRFGGHYAETLRRWRMTFINAWPQIAAQGFDETFRRKWEFYLAYCEAGFATNYLDVAQIQLTKGPVT